MKRSTPPILFAAIAIASSLFSEEMRIQDFAHSPEIREKTNLFEIADGSGDVNQQIERSNEHPPFPSQGPSGEMFKSAKPLVKSGWEFFAFGNWLYWKASEEGLDYGLQTKNPGTDLDKSVRGSLSKISPNYHSGYRFGFDLTFPHDSWDVLIQWTRYQNKKHDSILFKSGKYIWPTYLNENGSPSALEAFAKWDLSYSVLDLELGRAFFVGKHLSFRPFLSFEAAWIEQKLKVIYQGIDFNGAAAELKITSNNHNDFQGYGLRGGIETKWPFDWGWSLFGDLSFSLLYSEFDISQFEKNANSTPRTHVKDRLHLASRMVQMSGGIQWETQFYKDQMFLNIHAGWEQEIWFDQNQLNLFLNGSGTALGETWNQQGNLTLSGLTLGATFGF